MASKGFEIGWTNDEEYTHTRAAQGVPHPTLARSPRMYEQLIPHQKAKQANLLIYNEHVVQSHG